MTPLPPPLGTGALVGWRLDREVHAREWDSGEGAFLSGGRWNSQGARAVYCALDPATAILEVAVHKGFRVLDITPHVLTSASIDAGLVFVVQPGDVPNPSWLRSGWPSGGQQAFGDALLNAHPFVVLPSVVSTHSWNLVFRPEIAAGRYGLLAQERSSLDTRLNPPPAMLSPPP